MYFCSSKKHQAQVAELVDASVSKTDEVTLVPVRSRPRVQQKLFIISQNKASCKEFLF